jgi:hypothetical protein
MSESLTHSTALAVRGRHCFLAVVATAAAGELHGLSEGSTRKKSAERKAVQAALVFSNSVFALALPMGVAGTGSHPPLLDTSAVATTRTLFPQPKPLGSIFDLRAAQAPNSQLSFD